jgi:hypothetical protein
MDEPFRALLMNTKGMAPPHFSPLWKTANGLFKAGRPRKRRRRREFLDFMNGIIDS